MDKILEKFYSKDKDGYDNTSNFNVYYTEPNKNAQNSK